MYPSAVPWLLIKVSTAAADVDAVSDALEACGAVSVTIEARSEEQRFQSALEAPVVSGITLDQNVAKITVKGVPGGGGTIAAIFAQVAERGVNVDIIVHDRQVEDSMDRIGFTVQREDVDTAVEALESLRSRGGFEELQVSVRQDLAKVSAVGLGMRSHSGVAMRVFDTLTTNGIDIVMISTSEIKISCVVPHGEGQRSAEILHAKFFG